MRNICVFCGSNLGSNPLYAQRAAELGRLLALRGLGLIYGGGRVGLMGIVAQAALDAGGRVVGIIPEALMRMEAGSPDATELHVVESMHVRKAMMAEKSDAFIALPGGIGTMEEIFEIWTWGQLGLHSKPLGFLDVNGYFDGLMDFLDHMVADGFLKPRHRDMAAISKDPAELLDSFARYHPPEVVKIIGADTA